MPTPDHYTYDDMPAELRQKIVFRMDDTLDLRDVVWGYIEKTLTREYGRPFLVNGPNPESSLLAPLVLKTIYVISMKFLESMVLDTNFSRRAGKELPQ